MSRASLSAQEVLTQLDLDSQFLSSTQASKFLGTHRTYIYVLVRDGSLPPPVRVSLLAGLPPVLLHRKSDLEAYKATHPRLGLRRRVT